MNDTEKSMKRIEKEIRKIADKLLKDKKVNLIIGFEKGTLPLRARPSFVRRPEEVEKLIWNSFCENNLAVYVPFYRRFLDQGDRIALVAKGCDVRSLVLHIQENVLKRNQITIIGIPCEGMIDRRKLAREVSQNEIMEVTEESTSIIVKGDGFEKKFKRDDVLCNDCLICTHKKPVIYDEIVDVEATEKTDFIERADIADFESKSLEDRWKFFAKETDRCIRCYACRNACPSCYCNECFVDCARPQWIGTTVDDKTDLQLFQIIRTFHMAGRCVNCGSCTRACPMEIGISLFVNKLSGDAKRLFNYETGLDIEEKPVLNKYNEEDSNEGFFEENETN